MKVLAIIGSPRKKGNTYDVVRQVEESIKAIDAGVSFEYLFLRDLSLGMCTGCFACISKGEDKCPLKDDRNMLMERMMEADGIIFAAPSYAMGVPALMKNFIDRFAYTLHRPCFFDKTIMAVMTIGGVMGGKPTLRQVGTLAAGARRVIKLGVTVPPLCLAGMEKSAAKKVRKASRAFYRDLQNPRRKKPGMGDFAYFHAFKQFCGFEAYRKACPADDAYYREKSGYFYPLKGNPLRRLMGRLFQGLMRLTLKLMVNED